MNAKELLAGYGLTIEAATNWVVSNLNAPDVIYGAAKTFGITSAMLAEIVAPVVPGVTAEMVEGFFNSHGLNGAALHETMVSSSRGLGFLPAGTPELANLVSFNHSTGALSTASLKASVVAQTGQAAYNQAFNPSLYAGSEDGIFSAAEIGVHGFSDFAATQENIESLFYGTLVNCLKAIDFTEVSEILNFMQKNNAALAAHSEATINNFLDMMMNIFQDPTNQPVMTDGQISENIVISTVGLIGMVGAGQASSLFDAAFMGFLS